MKEVPMQKRLIYTFLAAAFTFSLGACGQTETKEETNQQTQAVTEKMTEAQTEEMVQLANPFVSYDSMEEAEKAAGFSFTFGKSLYTGVYKADTFTVIDGQMMDVTYQADGTDDMITIRQTKESSEDISGDYNSYSHDFTVSDCDIREIRLRGTKDTLRVTDFTYEGYTYVIYSDEGDYNEIFAIIGEMTGKDSEIYKKVDIDRKLFSKIRCNDNYIPRRNIIIKLCFALRLNKVDFNRLLNSAGYSLTNTKFDNIISYCIDNNVYDLTEINDYLYTFCNTSL